MLDLIYFLLIGLAAGWLAGQIMKGRRFGIVGNIGHLRNRGGAGRILVPPLGTAANRPDRQSRLGDSRSGGAAVPVAEVRAADMKTDAN